MQRTASEALRLDSYVMLDTMIWRTVGPLRTLVVAVVLGVFGSNIGIAQTCGTGDTIKEGETQVQFAARVYGDSAQWTPSEVACILTSLLRRVECLTADGFAKTETEDKK